MEIGDWIFDASTAGENVEDQVKKIEGTLFDGDGLLYIHSPWKRVRWVQASVEA